MHFTTFRAEDKPNFYLVFEKASKLRGQSQMRLDYLLISHRVNAFDSDSEFEAILDVL